MSYERLSYLAWFGLGGGAVAWAAQFAVGVEMGFARCEAPPGRVRFASIPAVDWSIALAAAAFVVGLLATATAYYVFRATADHGGRRRPHRIHFLAILGLTVSPLATVIIIMDGIGVPLLTLCRQA